MHVCRQRKWVGAGVLEEITVAGGRTLSAAQGASKDLLTVRKCVEGGENVCGRGGESTEDVTAGCESEHTSHDNSLDG